MEHMIFEIFIFCMFIILGVLIFGIMKWLFKYLKLCYLHINWKIKILIIFPLSALIIIPLFLHSNFGNLRSMYSKQEKQLTSAMLKLFPTKNCFSLR